ncbi:ubiquitin-domain-containing protein [Cristinia sonorae]|uniref:Ubiquitin-domain-containing protein n=1 Tax=Cristinia sonorae TaxID=1940300 RepID=A0A8K0UH51_9AGAR|nr:ubiquitin-domain-containing protein [Cristinia sonorae]
MATEQSRQAEYAFVKNFAAGLSAQPVTLGDDHQQPPQDTLKRIPLGPVDLPSPPEPKHADTAPSGSVNITIKSTKPAQSYSLSVQSTDTIATIKSQLASKPGAPPADVQRLLIKGKALADAKLLKEYDVKEGDTVNLMVKPGFHWDPTDTAPPSPPAFTSSPSKEPVGPEHITLLPEQPSTRRGHTRIPSVVLSPSPSLTPTADEKMVDIPLLLDTSSIPVTGPIAGPTIESSYHTTVSQPDFWSRLYTFLTAEFPNRSDAATAWEDFFRASKGQLSVSEIAKIRDNVGVIGMAGT